MHCSNFRNNVAVINYRCASYFVLGMQNRDLPADSRYLPVHDVLWNEHQFSIVVEGNLAKFTRNDALQGFLLGTGNKVLEASPVDPVWGIGLSRDDPDARQPARWKGTNLLGFALMEVRHRINSGAAQ
jgi:ribA/ribD-fused uncharacterized protein